MALDFTEAVFKISADPGLHFKKLMMQQNWFGAGPLESRLLRSVSLQMIVHTHADVNRLLRVTVELSERHRSD